MTEMATLFLLIVSGNVTSARTQRMTLTECQAELRAAYAQHERNALVTGTCLWAPETSGKFSVKVGKAKVSK